MTLMCAMWAFEWHFELANVFARLRERHFDRDTIPNASRLRFRRHEERAVCPGSVPHLSHFCPSFVPLLRLFILRSGAPMEDRLHDVLSGVVGKQGRSRLEPYGEFVDELRRQGSRRRCTSGDVSVQNVEKCCSAGWCGREQEGGGRQPPKFRVA